MTKLHIARLVHKEEEDRSLSGFPHISCQVSSIIHFVKTPRYEQGGEKDLNTDASITDGQLSGFGALEARYGHFR
jgi:hypothetical protein